MKAIVIIGAAVAALGFAGCEKAGENVDSAIEKAVDGKKDMKDGTFEKAGEAIDKTLGIQNKDNADNLGDAVDGDPKTKPN